MKELAPVRLVKNKFFYELEEIYKNGKNIELLTEKLGKRRAKRGMFEGDLEEGELEIGPVSYTHLDVYKRQGLYTNNFDCPLVVSKGSLWFNKELDWEVHL